MVKTSDRLSELGGTVKPYVERALSDKELRESVIHAFATAREVYDELAANRAGVASMATRVASDREIQESLRRAVEELRHAADRLQGRRDHPARNTSLLLAGIALGILFNPVTGPDSRRWLKERLFGGGDQFDYQPGGNSTGGA